MKTVEQYFRFIALIMKFAQAAYIAEVMSSTEAAAEAMAR